MQNLGYEIKRALLKARSFQRNLIFCQEACMTIDQTLQQVAHVCVNRKGHVHVLSLRSKVKDFDRALTKWKPKTLETLEHFHPKLKVQVLVFSCSHRDTIFVAPISVQLNLHMHQFQISNKQRNHPSHRLPHRVAQDGQLPAIIGHRRLKVSVDRLQPQSRLRLPQRFQHEQ